MSLHVHIWGNVWVIGQVAPHFAFVGCLEQNPNGGGLVGVADSRMRVDTGAYREALPRVRLDFFDLMVLTLDSVCAV